MDGIGAIGRLREHLDRANPVPRRLKALRLLWGIVLVAVTAAMPSGFVWYPLVRAFAGDAVADHVFSVVCQVLVWAYVVTLVSRPIFRRIS